MVKHAYHVNKHELEGRLYPAWIENNASRGYVRYALIDRLLVREAPKVPKTPLTLAIPLGCPPELNDKTLLLKTSHHTLTARYREMELEQSWKLHPGQRALIILEGAM